MNENEDNINPDEAGHELGMTGEPEPVPLAPPPMSIPPVRRPPPVPATALVPSGVDASAIPVANLAPPPAYAPAPAYPPPSYGPPTYGPPIYPPPGYGRPPVAWPPAAPPKPRKAKKWIVIFACIAAAGIVTGLIAVNSNRNKKKPFNEPIAQKHQETAAAFSPNPPATSSLTYSDQRDIKRVFDNIASGNSSQDYSVIEANYDFERHVEVMGEAAGEEGRDLLSSRSFREGMEQGLREDFGKTQEALHFTTHDIRFMRPWAGTSDEAIVYATVRTNGEVGERMRFWLRKKSGQWRIYDQEDLRYGMRGSTMGGGVLRKDLVNNSAAMKRISASMKTIKTGKQQLENEQYDNAAKSFAAAADPALPKPSEALRLTLLATAKVRQDKFNDALDLTRQAAQINPDIPLADLVKARAHNGLDEPDKALSALDRYDAAVGADFLSSAARGDALLFNGKREEALKCYRRGLDDEPDSPENFIGLCRLLGTDGIAELRTRIAKVPDVSILLDKVANDALGEHRVNQLEVAATLYRDAGKIDTDPMAAYTEAEVFAMKHQWAEAVKAFNRRLDLLHSSNRTRGPTDRELAIAMIHSKQVLDGYNLHTNKRAAMVIAGDELISAGDADTLTKLIARHKANDPQDALRLHYYSGELAELRNQLADAEKEYRAALPLAGADDWRVPIHHALVRVLFNSDRVAEAYNTIGPRKETLAELIRLAHSNKRPQALRQIADLVEAETPTDLIVIKYRADAAWMEKDYARCAQILLPRAREMCDRKDLAWQVRNPLVRSLLKTNRAAEAFAFARDTTNTNWHSDYLLALSATAAGDVSTAIPQLDKVMAPPDDDEDRTTVEDLLADEDFATALKSPKFAPWLRKHQAAGPSSPATRPSSVRPANP